MTPRRITDDALSLVDLGLQPNEASGLCSIESSALLERLGWTHGFWTVLDDGPVERCIAAIGHLAGEPEDRDGAADRWVVRRLLPPTPVDGFPPTDDGEAIAVHDGVVHVLGSLYGAKEGPLELERQFLARFHEADVEALTLSEEDADARGIPTDERDPLTAPLEVRNDGFALHRAINDALADSGIRLLDPGPKFRRKFVGRARKRAIESEKGWAWRLRWDDLALNIEGAAFLPGGELLIGLRFPVSADGHPLLVVVDGIEHAWDDGDAAPHVVSLHEIHNVGRPWQPVGVRDVCLAQRDGQLAAHLLIGNLDSVGKDSRLLEALPEGGTATSTQWSVTLVDGRLPGPGLGGVPEFDFVDLRRVEGLALGPAGHWNWVVDEDDAVGLRILDAAPPD